MALIAAAALGCGFGYYAALGFLKSRSAAADVDSPTGLYYVHGRAVDSLTGQSRLATGSIRIQEKQHGWVSSFELEVGFDRGGETLSAAVVGTGSGQIDGSMLRGSSTQQLITSSIPGVSTRFPLIPRQVGARVESETTVWIGPDGSIAIEFSEWGGDARTEGSLAFLSGRRAGARVKNLTALEGLPQLSATAARFSGACAPSDAPESVSPRDARDRA